ncbi:Predicted permease YjgP/YjgQ family [hydrothermal vent metagenome]|uniref:Predicted permease YjgP/YjgQ family n=1 Tax=hydrothermal vent metagenome TaxID=652676 RepID=A0A1W1CBK8_9ZZZZ
MVSIRSYLSSNFTKTFLTLFLPFFFIISLVYLVKISILTAKIQITFSELIQLFAYSIPTILFHTIPISFIASVATTLQRLSTDNELVALFALGVPARKVMYPLIFVATLFSILLFIISFATMPQTNQLYNAFKDSKKAEMTFNIIPEEFGQKFGRYYIYITDENEGKFKNTVIYYQDDNHSDQIVSANSGEMLNKDGVFSLILYDGKGYTFEKDIIRQIDYKKLQTYDTLGKHVSTMSGVGDYWQQSLTDDQRKRKMLFYGFISLIPILSLYLVASFSIINPRYQKGHSFIVIGATTILLYFIASSLDKYGTPIMLGIAIVASLIAGIVLFQKQVSRYF